MSFKRAINESDKDARRADILAAALDAFYESGFRAARMDDIAAQAGVTKGTIYLYFPSKDALFEALIDSVVQPNLERMEIIAQLDVPIKDVVEQILKFAPTMVLNSDMPRLMKVLISESSAFPDVIRNYREQVVDRMNANLTQIFTKAKARQEINIGDPSLTARLLIAPILMSSIWHVVFAPTAPYTVDVPALFEHHLDLFMRAIAPSGEVKI